MSGRKKRRMAAKGADGPEESCARWGELPREIVAMIANYTCTPVQPLLRTNLTHITDPDSSPYIRQEDRSLVAAGTQVITRGQAAATAVTPMGQSGGNVAGGDSSATAGASHADGTTGSSDGVNGATGAGIPGTFQPSRMNDTALAMRRVCRLWCEVLSEGVRYVTLTGGQSFTIWASHFPCISDLCIDSCADVMVQSSAELAPQQQHGGDGHGDQAGPGPSSTAAAAAAAANTAGRQRSQRAASTSAGSGRVTRRSGGGGAAAGPTKSRSLAALKSLRNLQISDTAVHLDQAASCTFLEDLLVISQQHQQQYGTYQGREMDGYLLPWQGFISPRARRGVSGGGRSGPCGGGAAGGAPAFCRRSALDRTLTSLPGLQRLRLTGVDASAARLGSALMELTGLSSLRLYQCRLPAFIGSPERTRSGHSNFGRGLVLNLGAKLQDLSLRGCSVRLLPDDVLAGLTCLRILDLSSNWLHVLPATVTLLSRLEYLDLQHNTLISLPDGMAALTRLVDLDLTGNYLHRLPSDFSQLTTLTFLNLSGLHGLDMGLCWPVLACLTNLHSLGLSDVDLSENVGAPNAGPYAFGAAAGGEPGAVAQQREGGWHGPLHALISALGPHGRLRELTLDGCGLNNLPVCLSSLTALSHLSLMENFDASGLPEEITSLRSLAVLGLGYLDLQAALPTGLFDMVSLRVLDLEQNFLPDLSPNISQLSNLQVLNLTDAFSSFVGRDAIPWAEIYSLTRLRHFSITGNRDFPRIARGIRALTELEVLQMEGLVVSSALMEELCAHVRGLTCLQLVDCGITALPAAITRMQRLADLQLARNRIGRLPAGLGSLSRLTDLGLRGNPGLRSLPADITRLTRLRNLSWDVQRSSTAPPSGEQLTWMASLWQLDLHGDYNFFAELAKSHGIAWPRHAMYD